MPPERQTELMQAVYGINLPQAFSKKDLMSIAPRKEKRVSFNLNPNPVASAERMEPTCLKPSLKHRGQTKKVQQATMLANKASQAKCQATYSVQKPVEQGCKTGTIKQASSMGKFPTTEVKLLDEN